MNRILGILKFQISGEIRQRINGIMDIFTLKRRDFEQVFGYMIFVGIWIFLTYLILYAFTQIKSTNANIFGYLCMAIMPFIYYKLFSLRAIVCYDEFFELKYYFGSRRIYYCDVAKLRHTATAITKLLLIKQKNRILYTQINCYLFEKEEIKKFEILVEEKSNL